MTYIQKNHKRIISVLATIALISPLLLYFTDPEAFTSWSKYAKHWNEIFLDLTLIATALVSLFSGLFSEDRDRKIIWNITLSQLDLATALSFFLILLTDVTEKYLEIPHIFVTFVAALLVNIRMWFYYKTSLEKWGSRFGAVAADTIFILGLTEVFLSTFWGEWALAFVMAVHILGINLKFNKINYENNKKI